jgi:hypothetical protein
LHVELDVVLEAYEQCPATYLSTDVVMLAMPLMLARRLCGSPVWTIAGRRGHRGRLGPRWRARRPGRDAETTRGSVRSRNRQGNMRGAGARATRRHVFRERRSVPAYDAERWSEFALGQLGASAALLGLVFVGLSINLRHIVRSGILVNRAGETVVVLGSVLVSATMVLIPAQSRGALTAELLAVAVATFAVVWRLQRGVRAAGASEDQRPAQPRASLIFRRALGLGAQAFVAVGAITLAVEAGGGLYWWPAAVIAAYVSALTNAWVLLIEILR